MQSSQFLPQDVGFAIRKQITVDKIRKEKEWDITERWLEDKMAIDMFKQEETIARMKEII